jgi:hypothetical protein
MGMWENTRILANVNFMITWEEEKRNKIWNVLKSKKNCHLGMCSIDGWLKKGYD